MKTARVIGNVVATIKHPTFEGHSLLYCALEHADGRPTGKKMIATDTVQAGVGDRVLILDEGNGARQVLKAPNAPVRAVIVGIIDAIEIGDE
jgi:microcompartment protein CcmK/EutM